MFTGLIETVGVIQDIRERGNYRVMTVTGDLPVDEISLGESIACDGACLTVVALEAKSFVVEASQETAARTILNGYSRGTRINLERALRVGDRLGGHFVTGHIDVVGHVDFLKQVGESWELAVKFDGKYDSLVVEKGSIAISGLSLTVNTVRTGWCSVNLIPHTYRVTTVAQLKSGDPVNLEFDMIGKYVLRAESARGKTVLTKDKLIESGW